MSDNLDMPEERDSKWFEEEADLSKTDLAKFESFCLEFFAQKTVVVGFEAQRKEANKLLGQMEKKLLSHLQENKIENYKSKKGTVYIQDYFSVKVPKDSENRSKFFGYLKDKGIFEDMITVHSRTLNSYYCEELDQAKERGDTDFSIPGIEEPRHIPKLKTRRK